MLKQRLMGARQLMLPYVVLVLAVIVNAIYQNGFFAPSNLVSILVSALPLILAATAQTLIVLVSGIDLSVGPLMSLVNVVCATLPQVAGLSIIASLLIGLVTGCITGVLVALVGLQPIVVTLAMGAVYTGIALYVLPNPGGTVSASVAATNSPWFVILLAIVLLVGWGFFSGTRFRQKIYAVGASEQAAYMSGIRVSLVKVVTYSIAGAITALGGIVLSGQAMSGDPHIADAYTLTSIAAVVFGGTSLLGGYGGVYGSFVSALVLTMVINIVFFLGVSSFYQGVAQGAILIFALALGYFLSKRRKPVRHIGRVAT